MKIAATRTVKGTEAGVHRTGEVGRGYCAPWSNSFAQSIATHLIGSRTSLCHVRNAQNYESWRCHDFQVPPEPTEITSDSFMKLNIFLTHLVILPLQRIPLWAKTGREFETLKRTPTQTAPGYVITQHSSRVMHTSRQKSWNRDTTIHTS